MLGSEIIIKTVSKEVLLNQYKNNEEILIRNLIRCFAPNFSAASKLFKKVLAVEGLKQAHDHHHSTQGFEGGEVANQGIRVNAVRPGLIDTEMHAAGGEPQRVERLKSTIPMQRGGSAHEVAEAIYWLISNKSSFTTGSFIDVSGGR